jgi:hypothetical protein
MAHFREVNGNTSSWERGKEASFMKHVLGPIGDALDRYEETLGTSPLVVIFTPSISSTGKVFKYKAHIDNIQEEIEAKYPTMMLLNIGYWAARSNRHI